MAAVGAVVGEISMLTDMPATATVTVVRPARYLAMSGRG
jgi:CRP-like cAMP-binding protein